MRKPSSLLLAGAMAFGLTAASAAVTAFTIGTVEEVPGTDTATATIAEGPCTGTYNVEFSQDSAGFTIGGTATRVAPEGDDTNLKFCQNQPAKVEVAGANGTGVDFINTSEEGDITFTFAGGLILSAEDPLAITIGPEAWGGLPD